MSSPRAGLLRSLTAEDVLRIGVVILTVAACIAVGVIAWFINKWFAITVYALTTVGAAVWWLRS